MRQNPSIDRGRPSRLAEYLGVSRQRVSQWFMVHHRLVPGWVVMPTLQFISGDGTVAVPALSPARLHDRDQLTLELGGSH